MDKKEINGKLLESKGDIIHSALDTGSKIAVLKDYIKSKREKCESAVNYALGSLAASAVCAGVGLGGVCGNAIQGSDAEMPILSAVTLAGFAGIAASRIIVHLKDKEITSLKNAESYLKDIDADHQRLEAGRALVNGGATFGQLKRAIMPEPPRHYAEDSEMYVD